MLIVEIVDLVILLNYVSMILDDCEICFHVYWLFVFLNVCILFDFTVLRFLNLFHRRIYCIRETFLTGFFFFLPFTFYVFGHIEIFNLIVV